MRLLDTIEAVSGLEAGHQRFFRKAVDYFRSFEGSNVGAGQPFVPRSVWNEFGEKGFLGVSLPEDAGGAGLGITGGILLNIACAEVSDCGLALGLHVQNEVGLYWLHLSQNRALADKWIPKLITGEAVACTCDTDDSEKTPTTARFVDGRYIVNGRKMFIVNGYHSDVCITTCIEPDTGRRITLLIDKKSPGVSVENYFDKRGSRLIDSATIKFDEVLVGEDQIVVKSGPSSLIAWNTVISRARFFVVLDAYLMLGHAISAISAHAKERVVAGRPLADWPVNRQSLARAKATHAVIRNAIAYYQARIEAGERVAFEIARLKSFAIDATTAQLRELIDLQGARGYMNDSKVLQAHDQLTGLRQSSGSQATMLSLHEADPSFWKVLAA